MDRNELWKLYYERDKEFEAAKGRRTILVFLFFVVVYYVLICAIFGRPVSLKAAVVVLLPSLFFAGIHFWVNLMIFGYLSDKGREEAEILARIRKQIAELE